MKTQGIWSSVAGSCMQVLVNCNHGSSTPGAGRGIAGKMCWVFTFASSSQCRANAGVLFLGENSGDYSCAW